MFNMFDMDGNKVLPIQDMVLMQVIKSDDHSKTDDLMVCLMIKPMTNYICTPDQYFTSHNLKQVITIDELLNMMAVFIEIGEGKGHKVSIFE